MDVVATPGFSPFLSEPQPPPQEPAYAKDAVSASNESMSSFFMVFYLFWVGYVCQRSLIEQEDGALQIIPFFYKIESQSLERLQDGVRLGTLGVVGIEEAVCHFAIPIDHVSRR